MILNDKFMTNMAKKAYKILALVDLVAETLAIFLVIWVQFLNLPLVQILALVEKDRAEANTISMRL